MKLRKSTVLFLGLGISVSAFADWIRAELISGPGNFLDDYQTCSYRVSKPFSALDGEIFTIRVKGSCPYSVEYNPETGQVRS